MHYVKNIGFVEVSGKKVMSKRAMALQLAKICGYHQDDANYTRILIENFRVGRQAMNDAWRAGYQAKQNGIPCGCRECATVTVS